ncbi:dITPase [Ignisphaera aggregans DSM 17230]|uniref:dITP/XTP pyrophosphatase n=1 Tax=Ignisphaera aggregans (strain DSM 17230 / JCM 13409 / AQ1.S1) TaxID=583356 RepID=E0SNW5_IGNAA|nr:dITPase [Ignisphaera aggregans DSM 17230]
MATDMKIMFVTNNMNKVIEANEIVKSFGIELIPIDVKKIEIQSDSLREIAIYAAKHAYEVIRKPVVVEDSGLFIDALNGFPGPYSSYVYRTIGLKGILKLMEGVRNRNARFIAIVALAISDSEIYVFEGITEGYIANEIRGDKGFGYDPIFIPSNHSKTFAEMDRSEKNMYSHRGKAFRALGEWVYANRDRLIFSQ